jgi:ATP/maltotriose-dependent transcriptional regulator MalT
MPKKKTKLSELTKELMEDKKITDVADLQSVLKEMLKSGVETLLEAELDEELGYDRYSRQDYSQNYRNGKSRKRVRTDLGEIELDVPRDRNGEFEPQIVPKHANDLSAIEDKVISMYGKGMSQRDISEHISRTIRTIKNYRNFFDNTITYPLSNGLIKGINNIIKVNKMIAFGYRSFLYLKNKILVMQNFVKLQTA